MANSLSVPLWCLVLFVAWTVLLVLALTAARLAHLRAGGRIADFGVPDDRRLIWRLYRAHVNALENLPLFASLVLVGAAVGLESPVFDALAVAYLLARLAQSVVHVAPGAGLTLALRVGGVRIQARFAFFAIQLACLLGLVGVLAAG